MATFGKTKLDNKMKKEDNEFIEDLMTSDDASKLEKRRPIRNGFIFLGRSLKSQWKILFSTTIIFLTIVTTIALVTWGVDYLTAGNNFNIHDSSVEGTHITFFESLWWVFITISTIGYGDIYPITVSMKCWAMFIGIIGIVFLSLYTAVVVNGFAIEMQKNLEKRRERREGSKRKTADELALKRIKHDLADKELEINELKLALSKATGDSVDKIEARMDKLRTKAKGKLTK